MKKLYLLTLISLFNQIYPIKKVDLDYQNQEELEDSQDFISENHNGDEIDYIE